MPIAICSLVLFGVLGCREPPVTPDGFIDTVFVVRHAPAEFHASVTLDPHTFEAPRTHEEDPIVDRYTARLGRKDRVNSNGVALTTAGAIVRQDRYNVHSGSILDPEDTIDGTFDTSERRKDLEIAVGKIGNLDELEAAIEMGDVVIDVHVHLNDIEIAIAAQDEMIADRRPDPSRR